MKMETKVRLFKQSDFFLKPHDYSINTPKNTLDKNPSK